MIRNLVFLLLTAVVAAPASAAVTFDWAYVGNAGNGADLETGAGRVSYNYAISKYEVTNAQYVEFLNSVDPTGVNARELYDAKMAGNFGGIEQQAGNADGAKYALKAGRAQNPVNFVSFDDAKRFTNWLHNGQGGGDTEGGVYMIGSGGIGFRSASAKFVIPNVNEWYKAAYHDASAGTTFAYYYYANGGYSVPVSDRPSDNPAAANYFNEDALANGFNDGFALSGSTSFPSSTNPLADVGAYSAAKSPYGTFDQNGNVSEWVEQGGANSPGLRGGSWLSFPEALRSDYRLVLSTDESSDVGFRVASGVPEPSSLLMASLSAMGLSLRRQG